MLPDFLQQSTNLFFDGSDLIKGKFIVDMNSMTVDDIQGRGKERLENHLRNDDFFGVSNYKEAILEFDSKSELSNGEYSIDANLTIKGITNSVVFKLKPKGDMGENWKGGFFCPCHGSKFDLAGRVFKGSPAPTNLIVPPHKYLDENTIVIGEDSKGKA